MTDIGKKMATKPQIGYLHGLYSAMGWDEEQYRFVLSDYGVSSTKDLSSSQAHHLIQFLSAIVEGEQSVKATHKQCAYIRGLWAEIDYSKGENGEVHLNAFLLKRFGKNSVEELTRHEAIKMVKMVKKMTKQAKARAGKTTVLKKTNWCKYCGSEIMWVQLKSGERVPFDFVIANGQLTATKFHNCKEE